MRAIERDTELHAAEWFARLRRDDVTEEEQAAFGAWLAADERNVEAFATIEERWTAADALRRTRSGSIWSSLQLRKPPRPFAITWPRLAWRLPPAIAPVAWAAPVILFVALCLSMYRPATTYMTGSAPERVTLSDGSRVVLGAHSRVRVGYRGDQRVVDVLEGQARFSITRDPDRPFVVMAANGRLEAVDTDFAVTILRKQAEVRVRGGVVKLSVSDPMLSSATLRQTVLRAGEHVIYDIPEQFWTKGGEGGGFLRWAKTTVARSPAL